MKYISEEKAQEAAANGNFISRSIPSLESKGSWYEVYRFDNQLIACVLDPFNGISCGEVITESEILHYVEIES